MTEHRTIEDDMHDALEEVSDAGEPITSETPHFVCDTLAKAAWAAGKLKRLRARQQVICSFVLDETERIQGWGEHEMGKIEQQAGFFESLLRYFFEHERQTDARLKSIVLPDATVRVTKGRDQYQRDEPVLVAWAKGMNADYVKVAESLDWAELKKHTTTLKDGTVIVTSTGEVLPGIQVLRGVETFKISLTGEDKEREGDA